MSETTSAGKGLGITGMILGILGLISAFIPCLATWAILLCVVGIILSAISISQAKKGNGSRGMGKAGLILSIIGAVVVIIWVFVIASVFAGGSSLLNDAVQSQEFQDALKQGLENVQELEELNEGK